MIDDARNHEREDKHNIQITFANRQNGTVILKLSNRLVVVMIECC
jgi:hypothetical protein